MVEPITMYAHNGSTNFYRVDEPRRPHNFIVSYLLDEKKLSEWVQREGPRLLETSRQL